MTKHEFSFSIRKTGNKIWLTKQGRRPVLANKKPTNTNKVLNCIFFKCDSIVVQTPRPKGNGVTGRYYLDVILKKLKIIIINDTLSNDLSKYVYF